MPTDDGDLISTKTCPTCEQPSLKASLRLTGDAPVRYLTENMGGLVSCNLDEFLSLASVEVEDVYCTTPGCDFEPNFPVTDAEF